MMIDQFPQQPTLEPGKCQTNKEGGVLAIFQMNARNWRTSETTGFHLLANHNLLELSA